MTSWFRQLAIKQKIIAITVSISIIVLLSAAITFMLSEWISRRQSMVDSTIVLTKMMGVNSTAALAFDDPQTAEEIFAGLNEIPQVIAAQIYTPNKGIFAEYQSHRTSHQSLLKDMLEKKTFHDENATTNWAAMVEDLKEHAYKDNYLDIQQVITLNNKAIGVISVQVDLMDLKSDILRQLGIVSAVFTLCCLFAYMLASYLQRFISKPITGLAQVMHTVSTQGDYSVRVQKITQDELGTLMDGFNTMLGQIQERDKTLANTVQELQLAKENGRISQSSQISVFSHHEP